MQREWDLRFGMWNVRSVYRAGSVLRWIFRKWDEGGMDWFELAQDRER